MDLTRRQAITMLAAGTLCLLGIGAKAPIAFADDGGGGGGGSGSGGSFGPDLSNASGRQFIWFDRGGFSKGANPIEPAQGWDDASITYFKNLMDQRMRSVTGNAGAVLRNSVRGATGKTDVATYTDAAKTALARARSRAGTEHARVVAVGWSWLTSNEWGNDYGFVYSGDWTRTFDVLIPRAGNATELPQKVGTRVIGWDNEVDVPGYVGQSWRNYIYNQGKADLTGTDYGVVVLAVADGWPEANGFITVMKEPTA